MKAFLIKSSLKLKYNMAPIYIIKVFNRNLIDATVTFTTERPNLKASKSSLNEKSVLSLRAEV